MDLSIIGLIAMEQEKRLPETQVAQAAPRYVIFATGGKQVQGIEGKTVAIEKIEGEPGDILEFKEVLFRKTAEGVFEFGQPYLETVVTASIVKQMKGPKLVVFKFKRRKKVRVKKGHRQPITVIRIETI
ncbi:MAG: 50S ribosomal protein L21 [Candidatus Dependentiae bacterium]|nr:50S ribosomal protein L21 [Candidatus Dependentiae bacterium]